VAETPIRTFRIAARQYDPAVQRALDEGTTLSELVRGWITDYGAGRKRVGPPGDMVTIPKATLIKLIDLVNDLQ